MLSAAASARHPHKMNEDPLTAAMAPPIDETAEEMTKRLKREIKAKQVSDQIDQLLKSEREDLKRRKAQRTEVKLLLLGQASSGKSTLLKQFQLFYAPDTVDAERASWRPVVYFNVIKAVGTIIDTLNSVDAFGSSTPASRSLQSSPVSVISHLERSHPGGHLGALRTALLPLVDLEQDLAVHISGGVSVSGPAADAFARQGWQRERDRDSKGKGKKRSMGDLRENVPGVEEIAAFRLTACREDIDAIWNHPLTQSLRKKQLQLEDSATYFLESIQRIAVPDYVPSTDDVLHVRLQTLGVSEHTFDVNLLGKPVQLMLYDVGGARGHRNKWVPYFDTAHAIIFLAPISAFDQYLEEDYRTNRIDDSLQLFTEICKNKVLKDLHLVLFLNKTDILKQKLAAGVRIKRFITSFGDRPNDYAEASQYFRAHFVQVHRRNNTSRRVLYSHFTSVIDTKATQTIIVNVADSIMRDYFAEARLV